MLTPGPRWREIKLSFSLNIRLLNHYLGSECIILLRRNSGKETPPISFITPENCLRRKRKSNLEMNVWTIVFSFRPNHNWSIISWKMPMGSEKMIEPKVDSRTSETGKPYSSLRIPRWAWPTQEDFQPIFQKAHQLENLSSPA